MTITIISQRTSFLKAQLIIIHPWKITGSQNKLYLKKKLQSLFIYWIFLRNLRREDDSEHEVQVLVFFWPRAASCPGAWALHFGAPCPVEFSHQGEWQLEKTKVERVLPDSGLDFLAETALLSSELQILWFTTLQCCWYALILLIAHQVDPSLESPELQSRLLFPEGTLTN